MFELQKVTNMLSKEELSDDFEFPAYSSDSSNNGIIGFTNNPEFICDDITPVYITFGDHTRTVNIAKKSFSVLDNVKVLKPFTSNEKYLLFIISSWKKQIPNLGYARHWKVARNCKIQLPLKEKSLAFSNPCDNIKNIDFDFMESFIRELEEERIRELNAYLLATGLKDYALSVEEEKALEAFKTVQWGEYRIGDLYKKLDLHNKDFDKREDTASEPTKEYSLPIVNAKHGDNGIMFYGKEDIFDSAEMTIDIVQNGAIATGDVYPQPQRTGILWDAYLIKALDHTDSKETLFFITSSIQKSIKQKFCYEFKATWDRVQRENIYLPTKNNKPDYATMETFIKAVEKLVIKDVVLYADSKIETTKNVIKKDFEYKINEDTGLLNVAEK